MTSNKPYLVKAYYDWINDNQLTPYILVDAYYPGVMVPQGFVTDGQIVLNISMSAVHGLSVGNELIEFNARFAGVLEHIVIPMGAIAAIYAKENGAGTSLPIDYPQSEDETILDESEEVSIVSAVEEVSREVSTEVATKPTSVKSGKPTLTLVK